MVAIGPQNRVGLDRHLRARPWLARSEDRAPGIGRCRLLRQLHGHFVEIGSDFGRVDRSVLAGEAGVGRRGGEHRRVVAADDPLVVDGGIDLHAIHPPAGRLGIGPVEFERGESHRARRAHGGRF